MGGSNPVRVQAMLKSPLTDMKVLFKEAEELVKCGAELIRCAIPLVKYAEIIYGTLKPLNVPLIADCHFQSRVALKTIEEGFNNVRLNPGNMSEKAIKKAVYLSAEKGIAIRLGFNSGSCNAKDGIELANLALKSDELVRNLGFENFLVSLKSSSVRDTVEANRFFSLHSDTPLHIGVTATGGSFEGIIKSSAAIGSLLLDGIGDTLRVSLTADSITEVKVACVLRDIVLKNPSRLQMISCPTCSRSRMDVRKLLKKFTEQLTEKDLKKPFKIAIMGCEVNGPGEAKECDIGICGTTKGALFIKKSKIIKSGSSAHMIKLLLKEFNKL